MQLSDLDTSFVKHSRFWDYDKLESHFNLPKEQIKQILKENKIFIKSLPVKGFNQELKSVDLDDIRKLLVPVDNQFAPPQGSTLEVAHHLFLRKHLNNLYGPTKLAIELGITPTRAPWKHKPLNLTEPDEHILKVLRTCLTKKHLHNNRYFVEMIQLDLFKTFHKLYYIDIATLKPKALL